MNGITLQNVVLPENCVKFYTSSPIDSGIETKIPISLMQYDSGMAIVAFTILEKNTIYKPPESVKINVRFEKPDGHGVYNPVLGTDENGVVYFQITTQMTVAYGSGTCCLELKTEDGIKYTKKVPVYISKNPVSNENIESTDEYKTFFDIYEEVKKIGGIVIENQQAIQEIHDNLSIIQQVPALSQQVQNNANQVSSDKEEVLNAKQSVDSSLQQVLQSETNAKQSETNAKRSEQISQQNAQTTTSDREYVESVMPGIEKADDYAIESKSWAVGGTGTREGEDVNNSKYWAEQAMAVSNGYLGYFDNPELLQQAHPTGNKGDWAIIGSTNTIWVWDVSTNKFVDTVKTLLKNIELQVQSTNWTETGNYYTIEFPVEKCTENSKIININLNKSNSETITNTDIDNFSNLFEYIETSNEKIILYSSFIPQISMSIICTIVD